MGGNSLGRMMMKNYLRIVFSSCPKLDISVQAGGFGVGQTGSLSKLPKNETEFNYHHVVICMSFFNAIFKAVKCFGL